MGNKKQYKEYREKLRIDQYKKNHPNECFCNHEPHYNENDPIIRDETWEHSVYRTIHHPVYKCLGCGKDYVVKVCMA